MFLNTSVFCHASKTTILPWTIVQLKEENHTFCDFFENSIRSRLLHDCRLLSAHIGPEKYSLDPVDTNIPVLPVITSFGRFLKYHVEGEESMQSAQLAQPQQDPSQALNVQHWHFYNRLM